MKTIVRFLAVFFLIGGLFVCCIGNMAQQVNQPNKIQMGAIVDGKYIPTESGYIGGSEKNRKTGESTVALGAIIAGAGGVALIGSFFLKNATEE